MLLLLTQNRTSESFHVSVSMNQFHVSVYPSTQRRSYHSSDAATQRRSDAPRTYQSRVPARAAPAKIVLRTK